MGDHQEIVVVKSEPSSSPPENCCSYGDDCYQKTFKSYPADHECYLKTFPVGFRFKPDDHELISHYLTRRISNQPLYPNIINEVKVYDSTPSELTEKYKEYAVNGSEWYFFTNRERKYPKGDRPRRDTGNNKEGYWKATGTNIPVKDKAKRIIGSKRTLVYYEWKPKMGATNRESVNKTDFKMHEYVLVGAAKPAQHPDSSTNMQHAAADQDRKGKAVSTVKAFTDIALCKIYWNPAKSKKRSAPESSTPLASPEDNVSPTWEADHDYYNEAFLDEPFVDPFPYFGSDDLTFSSEENENFERELKEENQTNDFFNGLQAMDTNHPEFYDCVEQQLLTNQQRSLIGCNRINIPDALRHSSSSSRISSGGGGSSSNSLG